MNIILLKSTLFCGTIHIALLILYDTYYLLLVNICFGIITSILCHSTTITLLKWLDRITMFFGIILNYFIIQYKPISIIYLCNLLLLSSIILYFLNKIVNYYSILHICSHITLTILHSIMIIY